LYDDKCQIIIYHRLYAALTICIIVYEFIWIGIIQMKILQISTFDIKGGAARATYRLHRGLREMDQDCLMLVRYKGTNDDSVIRTLPRTLRYRDDRDFFLNAVIQGQYIDKNRTDISNTTFSLPYPGYDLSRLSLVREADIINLHWVAQYQSPLTLYRLFSLGKPIVWTLHDQWAFTGGCHYSAGCGKFERSCENCPQLADDPFGLTAAVLSDKKVFFKDARLTVVTPSRWMAGCAKRSCLFRDLRVEVIPNALETDFFTPLSKQKAKERMGIGGEVLTLLFGGEDGSEKRKGFKELMAVVECCLKDRRFHGLVESGRLRLICFGRPSDRIANLGIPFTALGYLNSEEKIRDAYAGADIFVLPSLEDNLPNTMLEAMSCATPVVAFDVGGMPDLIEDGVNGILVPPGDVYKMSHAICSLLIASKARQAMGEKCRHKMENEFALTVQAGRYLRLYEDLIGTHLAGEDGLSPETEKKIFQSGFGMDLAGEVSTTFEPGVGVYFNDGYENFVAKALKGFAFTIYSKWQTAETDRNARLAVIGKQSERLSQLESEVDRWLGESRKLQERCLKLRAERNELRCKVDHLVNQVEQIERDRSERSSVIESQGERIASLEAEVDLWLGESKRLQEELVELRAERNELKAYTDHLQTHIETIEADREERLKVIESQGERIASLEAEVDRWLGESKRLQKELFELKAQRSQPKAYTDHLHRHIETIEADREERLKVIESQGERIASLEAEVDRWLGESKRLQKELVELRAQRSEPKAYTDHLHRHIDTIEAEREEKLKFIESQGERVEALESGKSYWSLKAGRFLKQFKRSKQRK